MRGRIDALGTCLLLCLLLFAACDTGGDALETCVPVETTVSWPADQAPHPGGMEWWYYTGHLRAADGRRWGFEVTIFQAYIGTIAGYAAHFAVTDVQKGDHFYDQKFVVPDAPYTTFDLHADDWSIAGEGDGARLRAAMEGYAADLLVTPAKPPAVHNDGTIDMGGGLTSFYYSQTRMEAAGTLSVDGVDVAVSGQAWMDHQWGRFEVFASDGWDWFSIQLSDDTELMLYFLHAKDGTTTMTGATFVDVGGCARAATGVEVRPTGTWTSPHTGATFPMGWEVDVAGEDLFLVLEPLVLDQELDVRESTLNTYWEGAVSVTGTRRGKAVTGLSYVELAGYGPWGD